MVPGPGRGARRRSGSHSQAPGRAASRRWRHGSRPGRPRPGGGAGPARDRGRTRAHRAAGKSAAAPAAAAGTPGERARGARAIAAGGVHWTRWRERAELARDAGQKAAAELQELLAEISVTRDRESEQAQALNALRTAGKRRWAPRCRPRRCSRRRSAKRVRQGDRMAEVASRSTASRASHSNCASSRAGSGPSRRYWDRILEAVCVDGLDSVADLLDKLRWRTFGRGGPSDAAAAARDSASLQAKVQGARAQFRAVVRVHRGDLE